MNHLQLLKNIKSTESLLIRDSVLFVLLFRASNGLNTQKRNGEIDRGEKRFLKMPFNSWTFAESKLDKV